MGTRELLYLKVLSKRIALEGHLYLRLRPGRWSGLMRGAVSVALAYYYFDYGAGMKAEKASHGEEPSSQQHRCDI